MQRIYAAIQGTGEGTIPGRDFGYPGIAAFGRNPNNVIMIMAKSQNDNAVLWEYVLDAKRGPTIVAYWLSIEPSSRLQHLAKGNASLFDGLNPIEEIGYGVSMDTIADGKGGSRFIVHVNAEQLKSRHMELLLEKNGTPFLGGTLDGKRSRALYAYLQLRRGLNAATALGEKAIEEIRMYGTDLTVDSPTYGHTIMEAIRPSV
jgi:hypothetical protein